MSVGENAEIYSSLCLRMKRLAPVPRRLQSLVVIDFVVGVARSRYVVASEHISKSVVTRSYISWNTTPAVLTSDRAFPKRWVFVITVREDEPSRLQPCTFQRSGFAGRMQHAWNLRQGRLGRSTWSTYEAKQRVVCRSDCLSCSFLCRVLKSMRVCVLHFCHCGVVFMVTFCSAVLDHPPMCEFHRPDATTEGGGFPVGRSAHVWLDCAESIHFHISCETVGAFRS